METVGESEGKTGHNKNVEEKKPAYKKNRRKKTNENKTGLVGSAAWGHRDRQAYPRLGVQRGKENRRRIRGWTGLRRRGAPEGGRGEGEGGRLTRVLTTCFAHANSTVRGLKSGGQGMGHD